MLFLSPVFLGGSVDAEAIRKQLRALLEKQNMMCFVCRIRVCKVRLHVSVS